MFETLKRLGMIGIGALSMAESEVQAVVADLRHKGDLSEEEGQKVLKQWRERVALNQRDVKELAAKAVQDALEAAGATPRDDFDALAERVEKLERRLDEE